MHKNRSLDKAISTLRIDLSAARTSQTSGQHLRQHTSNNSVQKAFVVIGINTAFSSKKRRDSIRETWLPKGMRACAHTQIPLIKVLNCCLNRYNTILDAVNKPLSNAARLILIGVDYSRRDIKNFDLATTIFYNIVSTCRSKGCTITSNPFC